MSMNKVGIIGFGQFGRFAAQHLSVYAKVSAFDIVGGESAFLAPLQDVCAAEYVIFAVPVQHLEEACSMAQPYIRPEALLIDVSSVKVKPLEIIRTHFPHNALLGAHPIFGPQSGKNGIAGFPIVLTNVSWSTEHYTKIVSFLSQELALRVIEKTPEAHDEEMARVQGLAHFIGRALKTLDIQDYDTSTKSYRQLLELRNLLQEDSWELFKTIQNENPYAQQVRKEFIETLQHLERDLEKD